MKNIRRIGWASLALTALLALAGFAFPLQLLCIDTAPSRADYLVVLGGDVDVRAKHAAELFRQGVAPRIIVSGEGDCELGRAELERAGVPRASVALEPRSRNTKENAEFSVRLLRAAHAQRAVVVTSWFHSRRALACFRHAAPEIRFDSSPAYDRWEWSRWGERSTGVHIALEYLKTAVYAVRDGIW